eukprot:TRINITY_DN74015_c0_g1_i1.p1 TRINITY_DN74015_c0_g1~~TRINITY_DN74015_c0_g1_i1.p1  ORF type:complete len:573 (-),score=82.37 TRINITY_DN74015_c0_g1_i1:23-1693(-)
MAAEAAALMAMGTPHTELILAAAGGRVEDVEAMLLVGADVNRQTPSGATPLYVAARQGDGEMVEALLRFGAKTEVAMEDGSTPLFIAAWRGHQQAVRALLRGGAQVNHATDTGAPPLFAAAMLGRLNVVEELLRCAVRVDQATDDGITPLMAAAAAGHTDVVRGLLTSRADASHVRDDGESALSVAFRHGHTSVHHLLSSSLVSRTLPVLAAAACVKPWRPPRSPFDWHSVEAAERTLLVELARAARKGGSRRVESRTGVSDLDGSVKASCARFASAASPSAAPVAVAQRVLAKVDAIHRFAHEVVGGSSASTAPPSNRDEETRSLLVTMVSPYLRLADDLAEVESTVAYYCRVFASGLLLGAIKRGLWSASAEVILVSTIEKAERAQPLLQLSLGREQLEAFVLICFRRAKFGNGIDDSPPVLWNDVVLLIDVLEWCQGDDLAADWLALGQHARMMAESFRFESNGGSLPPSTGAADHVGSRSQDNTAMDGGGITSGESGEGGENRLATPASLGTPPPSASDHDISLLDCTAVAANGGSDELLAHMDRPGDNECV